MRDLQFMWEAGYTTRYHTVRTLLQDTVGHHSYNVACILMHLRPGCSAKLLRAALKHDMAEHIVGDMPAPAKRAMGIRELFGEHEDKVMAEHGVEPEDLMPDERWVLKLADSLDGLRFCIQERMMGNRSIVWVYDNFRSYCMDLLDNREYAQFRDQTVFGLMDEKWRNINVG